MSAEDDQPNDDPHGKRVREAVGEPMKTPTGAERDYTDGRKRWDWDSHYPTEACKQMNIEVIALLAMLLVALLGAGVCLGLADQDVWLALGSAKLWVSFRLLATFCVGCLGGVTFSIKWLIHATAKGTWHRDRRYWRLLVPAIGGVYACVVITLFSSGMLSPEGPETTAMPATAALAFLIGYFSDGVSGLLSNVANAVFGTLEKK